MIKLHRFGRQLLRIYVMNLGFGGFYKIGIANDVEKRLHELSAGNPRITILLSKKIKDADVHERNLHKLFSDKREGREIYALDSDDLKKIKLYFKDPNQFDEASFRLKERELLSSGKFREVLNLRNKQYRKEKKDKLKLKVNR